MSEEKKAEQDERVAFEAEWKRSGWGDADTKNQCFHFWQARAASTSANVAQGAAIPDGWMLVPKKRGTKPLSELIIAASLACIENRLLDHDDRRELAEYADQLQNTRGTPSVVEDDAHWIDASKDVPGDEREVIVFLNGHCGLFDDETRKGGGWGVRLGWYDHDRRAWYVHGQREHFVTHWQDEPISPRTAAQSGEPK
jgi:hypothetical protein